MTDLSLEERIIRLIAERSGHERIDITERTAFVDDLGFDSLGLVELVMAMEDEFGISIRDEEAEKIMKVGEAVRAVTDLIQGPKH